VSVHTNISWAGGTWNCCLGCDKVSAGCHHCYAILSCWMKQHHPNDTIRRKFEGLVERRPDGSLNWTGKVVELPERLSLPIKTKTPTRWFVDSMSDPFHKSVSDDFIAQRFAVAALTPQHQYLFLTKRPERALEWFIGKRLLENTPEFVAWWAEHLPQDCGDVVWDARGSDPDNYIGAMGMRFADAKERKAHYAKRHRWPGWPLPNVWIGVSTEDQKTADARIPLLLQIPAAVRFLSCEPLIGPIQLGVNGQFFDYGVGDRARIDWAIVGGESGKDARRMELQWARDLRQQCAEAGVAYHFKQTGVLLARELGITGRGSNIDEIPEDLRVREFPKELVTV
jgi:protein gp37